MGIRLLNSWQNIEQEDCKTKHLTNGNSKPKISLRKYND